MQSDPLQPTTVTRLVTFVELDGRETDRQLSVSARLEAELADGRRVVLLDDRGWAESGSAGNVWPGMHAGDIERTARVVVGPDEPRPGLTAAEEACLHRQTLADTLGRAGVVTTGDDLAALRHDVALGARLRARIR